MSEPQAEPTEKTARKWVARQRALNALVFLLAVSVCAQGYLLWEMNGRLDAADAALQSARHPHGGEDWQLIPKSGAPTVPPDGASPNASPAPNADPLTQLGFQGWDPFSDFDRMRDRLDRVMGQVRPRDAFAPQVGGIRNDALAPRQLHVDDTGERYVIKAVLPGADAADVTVCVEKQLLSVCVKQERTVASSVAGHQRMSGQCTQRVTLPEPVDGAAMNSEFKDGVLTVTIPKAGRASRGSDSGPSQSVRR